MGYADGEAQLLTRIQALSNFGASNTSRQDWKLLNSGKSNHYAILRPGGFTNEQVTITDFQTNWTTFAEVWVLYTNEQSSYTNLMNYTSEIFGILAYPYLGNIGKVAMSSIEGGDEPQEMWTERGGLEWLRWQIRIVWSEITHVSYSE